MTPLDLARAADEFAAAREQARPVGALPGDSRPVTVDDGWRIQAELARRAGADALRGWKVAAVTPEQQGKLGVAAPIAARLLAPWFAASPARFARARFVRPLIECEIAFRLGRDLPPRAEPYRPEDVAPAIAEVMAAIELVDDRYVDWRQTDTPTLIADDFFGAGLVLGAPVPAADAPDLARVVGTTAINGVPVGQGRGADVLGHPRNALDWLKSHAAARGRPLQPGDIVSTGSLVETRWLAPGDAVMVSLSGLGSAAVSLSA